MKPAKAIMLITIPKIVMSKFIVSTPFILKPSLIANTENEKPISSKYQADLFMSCSRLIAAKYPKKNHAIIIGNAVIPVINIVTIASKYGAKVIHANSFRAILPSMIDFLTDGFVSTFVTIGVTVSSLFFDVLVLGELVVTLPKLVPQEAQYLSVSNRSLPHWGQNIIKEYHQNTENVHSVQAVV